MKQTSFSALLAAVALFHSRLVPFAGAQTTNYFCTGTTIDTAIYDGQSIVVDNCAVAVVGRHEFANVDIVTNGAMTCDDLEVDTNLTLAEGTTLTISGGSLLEVDGALAVETNATLICEGLNTAGQVSGQWAGVGVSIQAGSVTVAAGGTISADGQGYIGGQGPGAGTDYPGWLGGGGGYGGNGGNSSSGASGGGTYGSVLLPSDLGSGSGNGAWGAGGSGGGAIELSVAQTLTLNGTITADGLSSSGPSDEVSGGSGGSILIMANKLAGGGSVQADGGAGNQDGWSEGGGGRIAVYYTNAASLTVMTNSAASGANPGTTVFLDASGANLGVNLWFANLPISAGTTIELSYVTVNQGASMTIGGGSLLVVDGALTVQSNASLICEGLNTSGQVSGQWAGAGVSIQAGSVTVAAGGTISADGQGYIGGQGPGAGTDDTGWLGGGGGYGGNGADSTVGASGGGTYGSVLLPSDLGSGSGNGAWGIDGSGGGAIELSVAQTLTLNGTITADGLSSSGPSDEVSGGSGGSILILANNLAGSGSIQADGGAGNQDGWSKGGGGRIAVYYTNAPSLTVITNTAAYGANPGTAVFLDASGAIVGINVFASLPLNPGTTNEFGYLILHEGASMTIGSGSALHVDSYVSLSEGASMTIGGGSVLQVDGALTVQSNASVICAGLNTGGQVSGQWAGVGVSIQAGTVTVAAGGTISADGQGYIGGQGPGAGTDSPSWLGGGGGYGGNGADSTVGASGGGAYGSVLLPSDLGSGSGNGAWGLGGSGGGAIELSVAQTLTLNGTITADGLSSSGPTDEVSGGSGGSILIMANNLAGGGSVQADGGAGNHDGWSEGGGGRIAMFLAQALTCPTNSVTASGAQAGSALVVIKPPNLQMLPQADGGTYLNWAAFPIYTYQVQYCTNLILCNWSDLGAPLSPTNYTWLTVSNAAGGDAQGFYRVKVLP